MTDDNKRKKDDSLEAQLLDFMKEIGKLGWQMVKLSGKGVMLAYRAIAQRREREARETDAIQRRAETAAETVEDFSSKQRKQDTAQRFVEDADDPEAASLLEDFLQETAQKLRDEPEIETQHEEIEVQIETPQVENPQAVLEDEPADLLDGLVDTDVIDEPAIPEDFQPEQKEITYKTEDEQARIEEQIARREKLLAEEREKRKEAFEAEEREKREKQEQMKADLERIRQEKQAREEAFKEAEAERKRREAEQQQRAFGASSRLADNTPESDDSIDLSESKQKKSDS